MAISPSSISLKQTEESDWSYAGWRVVLAAHLGVMAGFGSLFVYTFSIFLKPLSSQFGWSREAVSAGFGLGAITVGICSPALGRALDRFAPRRVILPCMAIFGFGFASLGLLGPRLWQFYATCIGLGIVGNGAAQLAYSRTIVTWFHKRLGMALAFVMAGSGIGSIILPLIAQTIVSQWGWRTAYFLLGALALALGLPCSWRYVHDRCCEGHGSSPAVLSGMSWREGLRSHTFWIIVSVLLLNSASINGVLAHLSALLTDRGIAPEGAAVGLSILGATSLGGRLLVGALLDRFRAPLVAFIMLMPASAGILLLTRVSSLVIGGIAAALIGIGMGAEADVIPYLLTRYFGVKSFSTLYGLTWTFYAFSGGVGPVILGRTFDLTGSYTSVLLILGFAVALAASLMLSLPRYPDRA